MADRRLTRTANRSVVGTMNEFSYLAAAHRDQTTTLHFDALSLWLAHTPCGALRTTHGFSDRGLAAVVAGTTGRSIT
jgi:hypothetical protein